MRVGGVLHEARKPSGISSNINISKGMGMAVGVAASGCVSLESEISLVQDWFQPRGTQATAPRQGKHSTSRILLESDHAAKRTYGITKIHSRSVLSASVIAVSTPSRAARQVRR